MYKKYYFYIFAIFTLLMIAVASLRATHIELFGIEDFPFAAIVGFFVFLFATNASMDLVKNRLNPKLTLLCIWLGAGGLLDLPYRIFNFESTRGSLCSLMAWWCGILCGYLYWRYRERRHKKE